MRNLKDKKDNAEILSNFGPILISALVVLILVVLFGSWMANFEKKDAVNQITRKYILKMETTGGLTTEDKAALIDELTPYCTNILFSYDGNNTTMQGDAEYGEDIDLYLQADLYTYKFWLKSSNEDTEPGTIFQLTNVEGTVDNVDGYSVSNGTTHTETIRIHRSSTSKH